MVVLPEEVPTASMAWTTSMPLVTDSEDDVLAVEPRRLHGAEEKLGAVGVGTRVGHGEDAGAGVLELEVLVGELGAVDGLAAGAVVVGEVATLAHEVGDDAVEGGALEAEALLAGAERAEVLCLVGSGNGTFQTGTGVGGGSCFGFVGRFGGGSVVRGEAFFDGADTARKSAGRGGS